MNDQLIRIELSDADLERLSNKNQVTDKPDQALLRRWNNILAQTQNLSSRGKPSRRFSPHGQRYTCAQRTQRRHIPGKC